MLERTFLGIDIGTYSIKLVEYQRGLREGRFTRCAEVRLPAKASADDVVSVLTEELKSKEFSLDCPVTALSGTRITQRHFRLPFTGKQVTGAIRFEIEESLPVPIERMILTHDTLEVRPGETDVLATMAARTDIEEHLALVRRCGIEPRHVEVEGAVVANLSRHFGLGDAPRVFLDIGHSKTQVCLVLRGKPLLLRSIPVAGQRWTEALAEDLTLSYEAAEEYKHEHGIFKAGTSAPLSLRLGMLLDQLVREALRTLQSLVSDTVNPVAPAEIVLVGGSAAIPELPEYLAERMGIACRVLSVPPTLVGAGPLAQARVACFSQAAALALRGAGWQRTTTQMDFRREEFRYVPDLSALRPQAQWTALWIALLLVLWPISLGSQLFGTHRQVSAYRAEIERVLREISPDAPASDDPMTGFMASYQQTKELADHLGVTGSGASPLELLRRISSSIPDSLEVSLSDLRIEQKSIRARGFAPDASAANQVEQLLQQQADLFKTVTIGDLTRESGASGGQSGAVGFSFNLTIELQS